jgi:hypothetical protein
MRRFLVALALGITAVAVPPAASASSGAGSIRVERDVVLQHLFDAYGDAGDNDRWTGSDSAISIPLPDGRFLWTGVDTFLGKVNKDHSRAPQSFIHNCYVIQERNGSLGETLYTHDVGGGPKSYIQSDDKDNASWFWLGDAFVEGGKLRQMMIRVTGQGYAVVASEIATFSLPGLQLEKVEPSPGLYAPGASGGPVDYGEAVVQEKDWTYLYGIEGLSAKDPFTKFLHVARARTGHVMEGGWQYWDGAAWSDTAATSAQLADGVGNEMSVVKTKHGYRAISMRASLGSQVLMFTAKHPQGPWSAGKVIYTAPENNSETITYNAKEHPEHHGDNWISVSYNVNASSTNTGGLYSDVRNYRPRFLRVYVPPDL